MTSLIPHEDLKAPFPWFGGKRRVAHIVWERFGDTYNFVEPFAGSLAVLLARPHAPRCETINDKDAFIANFWRSVSLAPDETAYWANWPVNEADLHARHAWLIKQDFAQQIMADPEWHDPKIAGWWVWGISQWIGGGWCKLRERRRPASKAHGIHRAIERKRPIMKRSGFGVHRQLPGVELGGVHRQLPDISGDSGAYGRGVHACGLESIQDYFTAISERLRRVRICCGDWSRIMGPSPTYHVGVTGVLLDPPYAGETGRDNDLYRTEDLTISKDVREWCLQNGDNPLLRIALCGYEGEHDMPDTWDCYAWQTQGGYANQADGQGRANASRERIWFSPACLKPQPELSL